MFWKFQFTDLYFNSWATEVTLVYSDDEQEKQNKHIKSSKILKKQEIQLKQLCNEMCKIQKS